MRKRKDYDWKTELLVNYFEGKCTWCTNTENLHLHHIIPLSKGGENNLGNLELVCYPCHRKLHSQIDKLSPLKKRVPVKNQCKNCKEITRILRKGLCWECLCLKRG